FFPGRPAVLRWLLRQGRNLRRLRLAHWQGPRGGASPARPHPRINSSMTDDPPLKTLRQELAEPLPHPDTAALRDFSTQAMDWVWRHYTSLREQRTGQTATRPEMEKLLREPPPEAGRDFAQVLADFQDKVAAKAFRPNHPRFFAFIPSAPTYLSILGELRCAGTNFFQAVWLEAPGPSAVELLVLDWFKEFLGYPREARGLLTSGGSEANLTALLVARERLGLAERERAVLYVTEQRHWSVDRAAKIIGL